MAHFCRKMFPTILTNEGVLIEILKKCFAPNKYLYSDLDKYSNKNEFVNYINKEISDESVKLPDTGKTPTELLDEVGYNLYKCESEKDIQSFKNTIL